MFSLCLIRQERAEKARKNRPRVGLHLRQHPARLCGSGVSQKKDVLTELSYQYRMIGLSADQYLN